MSFTRPDPASPAQVADATFSTGRRGFDQEEVRDFLRMVSAELGRLHERERFLERELRSAQAAPKIDASQLDDEALTRLLGEETARVLNAARESATEIREKAEQSAARLLTEASDEAARRREEAEIEASRRRSDAATDAEAELSMAKQQGREMVNEARAYRERVLSELARRRELAREQIEQLIHGRDRLMQSLERARLVAVDVVAEMQPLGEPDEYVNLQPTTGPVPVMVARDATPRDEKPEAPEELLIVAADSGAADANIGSEVVDEAVVEVPAEPGDDLRIVDDAATRDLEAEDAVDDADSTELVDGDGEAAPDGETAEEAVGDERAAGDADDSDEGKNVEGENVEGESVEGESDEGEIDENGSDDVVVDLFARLRGGSSADDAGAAAEPVETDRDDVDSDDTEPGAVETGAAQIIETAIDSDDDDDVIEAAAEATVFEQRDADLTPLIVASAKKLKRVLADEQNEVLDGLRRSDPVVDLDVILPWASEHAARYSEAIAEDLRLAANAGAQVASTGKQIRLRKGQANDAVEHAASMVDQWLVGPLRDRLARCVRDGDGDNTVITKKVRAVYREWKTQHIDETLDDVLRAAHGRGALAAIDLDTPTLWTLDPRHGACPDCDDNALEGVVAAGQPFPTGHTFAPAHPGCRCMLLPAAL